MGSYQFSEGADTQFQNNRYCSAICFVQKAGSKTLYDARMLQISLKKVNQDSETILFNFINTHTKKTWIMHIYFEQSLVACAYKFHY